jgi:hypothetical protein
MKTCLTAQAGRIPRIRPARSGCVSASESEDPGK